MSMCAITHECEWPRVQCLRVQGPLVLASARASTTTHTHSACQVCTGGAGAVGAELWPSQLHAEGTHAGTWAVIFSSLLKRNSDMCQTPILNSLRFFPQLSLWKAI